MSKRLINALDDYRKNVNFYRSFTYHQKLRKLNTKIAMSKIKKKSNLVSIKKVEYALAQFPIICKNQYSVLEEIRIPEFKNLTESFIAKKEFTCSDIKHFAEDLTDNMRIIHQKFRKVIKDLENYFRTRFTSKKIKAEKIIPVTYFNFKFQERTDFGSNKWFGFNENQQLLDLFEQTSTDKDLLKIRNTNMIKDIETHRKIYNALLSICAITGSKQFVKYCRGVTGIEGKYYTSDSRFNKMLNDLMPNIKKTKENIHNFVIKFSQIIKRPKLYKALYFKHLSNMLDDKEGEERIENSKPGNRIDELMEAVQNSANEFKEEQQRKNKEALIKISEIKEKQFRIIRDQERKEKEQENTQVESEILMERNKAIYTPENKL
jgi:hypothetical protein